VIKVGNVVLVNPSDRDYTKHRYVLAFGAHGWTVLVAWASHLEDALDECVDWIAEHAPGLLADEQVAEAYREAIAEGHDEETAQELATVDTTCAGNAGHYLLSWEWTIVCVDPSRAELKSILGQ
jgi:hypothetical protein